jgi:large repetitive protein
MGEVGVTYGTVVLAASGGVKPYKWSIQAGALPPGLALSTGGSTTGKPTKVGTFSFSVRVDDSAGAAAGAPSSVMVFRQLVFTSATSYVCSGRLSCALKIPYTGGLPGDKPAVKVLKVTSGAIGTRSVTGQCVSVATSNPPPGTTTAASGGTMTLSLTIPNSAWCSYSSTVTYELVDHSPCGAGFLCTSSSTVSVIFKY